MDVFHKSTITDTRLAIVDYLKALCIVLIVFHHTYMFDVSKPFYIMIVVNAVPVFMMLSGYVMGLSSAGKSLAELYEGGRILRKLLRYVCPMLLTFLLHEILRAVGQNAFSVGEISLRDSARRFILCEYGPGSYYFAMMMEFLFISPLIFAAVRRYGFHGVLFAGLLDFFYEFCCGAYGIDSAVYRVLIFRYLFAIAIGMYIGLHKGEKIKNEYLIISLAIGLIYKLLPYYFGYEYRIFTVSAWASSSMMAVIYAFPIVYLILHYGYGHKITTVIGRAVGLIGRASYHIMCTQMIYFSVRPYFCRIVFHVSGFGRAADLLLAVAVSLLTGVAYYLIDDRFMTGRLIRRVTRAGVSR